MGYQLSSLVTSVPPSTITLLLLLQHLLLSLAALSPKLLSLAALSPKPLLLSDNLLLKLLLSVNLLSLSPLHLSLTPIPQPLTDSIILVPLIWRGQQLVLPVHLRQSNCQHLC